MDAKRIAIIGLGYVGLPLAHLFATQISGDRIRFGPTKD